MLKGLAIALVLIIPPLAFAQPNRSPHAESGTIADLSFRPESSAITGNDALALGRVAGWAKDNPTGLVVLDGYGDSSGSRDLAVTRGTAVRDALVGAGVDPARIVVAAYASTAHPRHVTVWVTKSSFSAVEAWTASRGGQALPHPLL